MKKQFIISALVIEASAKCVRSFIFARKKDRITICITHNNLLESIFDKTIRIHKGVSHQNTNFTSRQNL